MDCEIRDGKYQWKFGQKPSFLIVPGVDCVGIVTSCSSSAEKSDIVPGDRVASFLLHGCNAKYRLCTYTALVRMPKETNPFEAVALIRAYTAAFQALMQGMHGHSHYSPKPLLHKRVLIVGPCGTFERALVELSIYLGARKVYFSAHSTSHSHDMYIRRHGAKPLSNNPDKWLEHIEGKIDIAIESVCIDRYEHTFAALDEDGILVVTGMTEIDKTDDIL
jgi:NADPH:quinone reductase-like Zn-dependent oxidoreductase